MAISFLGIKDPVGFGTSSASNHKPVKNNPDDVSIVQDSLNQISPAKGGPSKKLPTTGKIMGGASDPTVRAIRDFQRFHFGFEDGVVDPNNKTEQKIHEILAGGGGGGGGGGVQPSTSPGMIQPSGERFLLTEVNDNRAKQDLDFAARDNTASFIARQRVNLAMGDKTLNLEGSLQLEMAVGGPTAMVLFNAWVRNTALTERNFPALDGACATTPGFGVAAGRFESKLESNLREQFRAGKIDYHDLVTGGGPTRGIDDDIPTTEPGKATGRPLTALEPPFVQLSLTDDRTVKICIGSFQGVKVFLSDFQANVTAARYQGTLFYELRDHFGVDDADCEISSAGLHGTPGQVSMWVLQHHRRPGHMPWITLVKVKREIKGRLA
jgi:hypothetical protein